MLSIRDWLTQNNFGEYCDAFERERITVATLPMLKDEELVALGVTTIGERHRLRMAAALAAGTPFAGGFQLSGRAKETDWLPPADMFKPLYWAVPLCAVLANVEWSRVDDALDATLFITGASMVGGALHLRSLGAARAQEDRSGLGGFALIEIGLIVLALGMFAGHALGLGWRMDNVGDALAVTLGSVLLAAVPTLVYALTLGSLRRRSECGRMLCGLTAIGGLLSIVGVLDASDFIEAQLFPMRGLIGREVEDFVFVLKTAGLAFFGSMTMFGVRGFQAAGEPLEQRQPTVRAAVWWIVTAHVILALMALFFFLKAVDASDDAFVTIWVVVGVVTQAWVLRDAWTRMPEQVEDQGHVDAPAGSPFRFGDLFHAPTADQWTVAFRDVSLVLFCALPATSWAFSTFVSPLDSELERTFADVMEWVPPFVLSWIVAFRLANKAAGALVFVCVPFLVGLVEWMRIGARWDVATTTQCAAVLGIAFGVGRLVAAGEASALAPMRLAIHSFGVTLTGVAVGKSIGWIYAFVGDDASLWSILTLAPCLAGFAAHQLTLSRLDLRLDRSHGVGALLGVVWFAALKGWDPEWSLPIRTIGGIWILGHVLPAHVTRRGQVSALAVVAGMWLLQPILPFGTCRGVAVVAVSPSGARLTDVTVLVGGEPIDPGYGAEVPAGLRSWTFQHPLLEQDVEQWRVARNYGEVQVTLPVTRGYVEIAGSDPAAPLFVDGSPVAGLVAPDTIGAGYGSGARIVLTEGSHVVSSDPAGWAFTETPFDVKAGDTVSVTLRVDRLVSAAEILGQLRAALVDLEVVAPLRQAGNVIEITGLAPSMSDLATAIATVDRSDHLQVQARTVDPVDLQGAQLPFSMRVEANTPTPVIVDGMTLRTAVAPHMIKTVTASSEMPPGRLDGIEYTFGSANLLDGRLETAWRPADDAADPVVVSVAYAPMRIGAVRIANGLQTIDGNGDLFLAFQRVGSVTVQTSNGHTRSFGVRDVRGWTTLWLEDPAASDSLQIRIDSGNRGGWGPVTLAEIQLLPFVDEATPSP